MTQPLTLTYAQQVQVYRDTAAKLLDAIRRHQDARARADSARDALDDKRTALLVGGVPGGNRAPADVREAQIARALAPQVQAHRAARDELRMAESYLEAARIAERAERETLRMLQITEAPARAS